jgi:hypothetical protein
LRRKPAPGLIILSFHLPNLLRRIACADPMGNWQSPSGGRGAVTVSTGSSFSPNPGCAHQRLNPEQLLVIDRNVIEDLLHVAGLGQRVIVYLYDERRNPDILRVPNRRHLVHRETSDQLDLAVNVIDPISDAEDFGNPLIEGRRETGCGATMHRISLKY